MPIPLNRTLLRRCALAVCVAAGAFGGARLGLVLSQWTWGGFDRWLTMRPGQAAAWSVLGAAVAGALLIAVMALPRLAQRRGASGSGRGKATRSAEAGAESTGITTSRRRRERTGKVSLQHALAGVEKTALRA